MFPLLFETMNSNPIRQQCIDNVKDKVKQAALQAGRNPDEVTIVAVSKTKPVEDIRRVYQCGMRTFGESKVQEAEEKIAACADLDIEWHLIGHLQTNKVKKAVELFDCIHSVDSQKLAEKINREAEKTGKIQPCFMQINVSGEESKFGIGLDEWKQLLDQIKESKNIQCIGLMTIPPKVEHADDVRPYFQKLVQLAEELKKEFSLDRVCLSMGMSGDYEVAVQEGATHVRVGTAIFGQRDYSTNV